LLFSDLKNTDEYSRIVKKVKDNVGDNGLTVLLNNAGVSTKFTRLPLVKKEQLFESLTINTIAPILLAKVINSLNYYVIYILFAFNSFKKIIGIFTFIKTSFY
jgi:short-subunit dehydrogenase